MTGEQTGGVCVGGRRMCPVLTDALTLSWLGIALQGCQGLGRKGQGSQRHDQSGTSGKYEQRQRKD